MTTLEHLQSGNDFENMVFERLDLQGFVFADREFFRCTFRGVKLQASRWTRAVLEECTFEDCDLTGMFPGDVLAHGVRFKACKLMGVEWTKASLNPQLTFEDCILRYTSFLGVNLRATSFARCNATDTNFIDVDLADADFSGSDLTGSKFEGATLSRTNLTAAQGVFLDPSKNRVKGVRIGVESAVLLASFYGMKVSGFQDSTEAGGTTGPRRSRR